MSGPIVSNSQAELSVPAMVYPYKVGLAGGAFVLYRTHRLRVGHGLVGGALEASRGVARFLRSFSSDLEYDHRLAVWTLRRESCCVVYTSVRYPPNRCSTRCCG